MPTRGGIERLTSKPHRDDAYPGPRLMSLRPSDLDGGAVAPADEHRRQNAARAQADRAPSRRGYWAAPHVTHRYCRKSWHRAVGAEVPNGQDEAGTRRRVGALCPGLDGQTELPCVTRRGTRFNLRCWQRYDGGHVHLLFDDPAEYQG